MVGCLRCIVGLCDGGRGQLRRAHEVLAELQVDDVSILGIAKGPSRKPGLEKFFTDAGEITIAPQGDAAHLLQHIRDEAHRFAITGHRQRRQKQRRRSELDDIAGVGPKRRRELLTHFGGMAAGYAYMKLLPKLNGWNRKRKRAPKKTKKKSKTEDDLAEAIDNIFDFEDKKKR